MIEQLVKRHYNILVAGYTKLTVGAGSNTYHVTASDGVEYILKNANINEANNPQNEPEICEYLRSKDLPVSQFILTGDDEYLWKDGEDLYHMQKYVTGENYGMHGAPDWLMEEMPQMLGRIHTALKGYKDLPIGIGENFFKYVTPQTALTSYKNSYEYALQNKYNDLAEDLRYRIDLMPRFITPEFDLSKLTRNNTHGDYFISQLICNNEKISAVIDWTTASIHPVVWEIVRSFIYGNPNCANGEIIIFELLEYTRNYIEFAPLNKYDLKMMPYVFYYQISVCDYYGQYFQSTADNRNIYLGQAVLSTKLMRWFENHAAELSEALQSLI